MSAPTTVSSTAFPCSKPRLTRSELFKPSCLVGEWIGHYRGHFEEVIRIELVEGQWVATKITGDDNVPAGEMTWRCDSSTGCGQGQIADYEFRNARLVPGFLEILSCDRIRFTWQNCGVVEYRRDD